MKISSVLAGLVCLNAGLTLYVEAQQHTFNGWISDSQCAARGTKTNHRDCARKCVEMGKKLVFVSDSEGKVFVLENPERLKGQEGTHVTILGRSNDNDRTIVAESWSPFGTLPQGAEKSPPESPTNANRPISTPTRDGPMPSPPEKSQAEPAPLTDFVDTKIVRDIRDRLGNCGGKINVTDVKLADKVVSQGQGQALLDVTADWVAPYNAWAVPMECIGFAQGRGKNQKARVRAVYNKWESGWRLEHLSINDLFLF